MFDLKYYLDLDLCLNLLQETLGDRLMGCFTVLKAVKLHQELQQRMG